MWIVAAVMSAFFAGVTSVLSKCGLKNVNSDVATAVRTFFVLLFAWAIVFITGAQAGIAQIGARSWVFLILSGCATGASWLCYFKALSLGDASKVAAVDKSSVVLSVLFALFLFPDERDKWLLKLILLAFIAAGTCLMTDIRRGDRKTGKPWLFFSLLSAVFAAATSVLAKIGVENVDSNLATAIRTGVVLVLAWAVVFGRKESECLKTLKRKDFLVLLLSGAATGASWLCYYYALQQGEVSIVVPIDKLSILVTVIFSRIVFREKLSARAWLGLGVLTAATVLMAVFT